MNLNISKEHKAEILESLRRFAALCGALRRFAALCGGGAGCGVERGADGGGARILPEGDRAAGLQSGRGGCAEVPARTVEDLPAKCFEEPMRYWEGESGSRGVRRKPEK
jgi:hypothetical protein